MPTRRRTHNTAQLGHYTKQSRARNTAEFKRNRLTLLKDKPPCHWCGTREASTADHLLEVDRWPDNTPGINSLENLVAACKQCNSSRGARYGNLKRKNIYEPAPKITNVLNTNNRIFIQQTADPDSPIALFHKGLLGSAETGADQKLHNYTAPYQPRLETAVERDGTYLADGVVEWARECWWCVGA